MLALHDAALAFTEASATTPADLLRSGYDINQPISPQNYAALRAPFNTESPSLNPGGALATLTWEPEQLRRNGRQSDDDMVVVADVFSNGSASLADVMQRHAIGGCSRTLKRLCVRMRRLFRRRWTAGRKRCGWFSRYNGLTCTIGITKRPPFSVSS